MKRSLIRLALTSVVVVPLAACSDSKNRDEVVVAPTPPPVAAPPSIAPTSLESISATFATLFRASADTEPRDSAEGDLPPVNFTTEPVDITGA